MRFTVGQALTRWMSEEIIVDSVNIESEDEYVTIEVVYTSKEDLQQSATRIQFK